MSLDTTLCCLSGEDYTGLCPKGELPPNGPDCNDRLKTGCAEADRMFQFSSCQKWCAGNKPGCDEIMSVKCNDPTYFNTSQCKAWCVDNPGKCDAIVKDWCGKYNDPICSCLHSQFGTTTKYNPACQDANCDKTGYKTASMLASKTAGCPTVDCETYWNVLPNAPYLESNIAARCGPKPTKSSFALFMDKYKYILIGLLLLIILIAAIVGFLLWRRRRGVIRYTTTTTSSPSYTRKVRVS